MEKYNELSEEDLVSIEAGSKLLYWLGFIVGTSTRAISDSNNQMLGKM